MQNSTIPHLKWIRYNFNLLCYHYKDTGKCNEMNVKIQIK